MRHVLISVFTALCILPMYAQSQTGSTRQLEGRVVEVTNGQTKGVSKVTVSISDNFDYDITDENGYFKLTFPPDREYVTVVVENTPDKMISPPSGLVNVPPARDLEIILCGEQNKKLMQQVNALSGRIKKLEKENTLTKRQLLEMHTLLLDTILYFENFIARLEQQSKETKELHDAELKARDARIRVLEDSVSLLVTALGEALEERFLKQKEYFDQISAGLEVYYDRLYDLRDRLMPQRLPNYFNNSPGAASDLKKTIDAYNEMRETIVRTYKSNVIAVRQYWNNPDAAEQLSNTYDYLLKEVHDKHALPFAQAVVGPIQDYSADPKHHTSAKKESKKAAEEKIPGLSACILELDKKIQEAINLMSKSI